MLNRTTLIGRLTRDPEQRETKKGVALAKFTLAVDRSYNRELTDFIDIVAFSKLGELCLQYLSKGRLAAVDGRLEINSYEDGEGIRRKSVSVVADNVSFLPDGKQNTPAATTETDIDDEEGGALPF